MALFTMATWYKSLPAERRGLLDLPAPAPRSARSGPATILTSEARRRLATRVARRRRDIDDGRVRFETAYGSTCSAADAIRSLALDELRARLVREGNRTRAEIDKAIDECHQSDAFRSRVRWLEAAYAQARRLR
jgi:hypothetical protein